MLRACDERLKEPIAWVVAIRHRERNHFAEIAMLIPTRSKDDFRKVSK
jgi:hypothetical protein